MIYATPSPTPEIRARLEELDGLRRQLRHEVDRPVRWIGPLRRSIRASSIESSTSIEGYSVAPQEAAALVAGAGSAEPEGESPMAVACYGRAMDHVAAMAGDPAFRWLDRVVLDLHFDACYFQPDRSPGRWRSGPIGVTGADGSLEFEGPDAEAVPDLIAEVVAWLQNGDLGAHVVVRAAMAHLHVTSVHPFRDGNGRVARIVQSLVLAREGLVSPEFASIEEYLGSTPRPTTPPCGRYRRGRTDPSEMLRAGSSSASRRTSPRRNAGSPRSRKRPGAGSAWKRSSPTAAGRSGS